MAELEHRPAPLLDGLSDRPGQLRLTRTLDHEAVGRRLDGEHAGHGPERAGHLRRRPVHLEHDAPPPAQATGELAGAALGDQPPARDDDDPLAQRRHLGKDVAREEDGALAAQAGEQLPHLHHLRGVEADGRLVEEEDRRLAEQRLRQADALAVALRQRADAPVGHAVEPACGEHTRDRARLRGARDALHAGDEAEVRLHAEVGVEGGVLGEVADRAPAGERLADEVVARHPHLTRGRKMPASIRIVVVLPAPFGPRKPTISPAPTPNETPATASTRPNDFLRSRTSSAGSPGIVPR